MSSLSTITTVQTVQTVPTVQTVQTVPTFYFIKNPVHQNMLECGFHAIDKEGWAVLRDFNEDSFISPVNLDIIDLIYRVYCSYDGHNRDSLNSIMRHFQYIAKFGIDVYKKDYLENM